MEWENEYQLSGSVIIINGDGGCRLWQLMDAVNSTLDFIRRHVT